MFDIFAWQHILIMLIVALVVVGPKDLPRLMNIAGKWAGKARTMAGEFRRSFDEMARESELAELRKEIDDLKKNNPISDIANSMNGIQAEVSSSFHAVATETETVPETVSATVPETVPETVSDAASVAPRSGEMEVTDKVPVPSSGALPS
jgi:sec-independent protein translocase protein TatB